MKMYDFSMLASREADANGVASATDYDSVIKKMDSVASMLSREIFDGFYGNGIHLIRLGQKTLRFQKFVTSGIYSLLIHFGDASKNIAVTFSLSVKNGDDAFRVMRVDNLTKRTIPYPFDTDSPSSSDVAFVADIAKTLRKDIEELMDSQFRAV